MDIGWRYISVGLHYNSCSRWSLTPFLTEFPMTSNDSNKKVSALVAAWLAGEHTMFEVCTEEPEIAWRAIIEISRRDLSDEQAGLLAAGPLETLLAWHSVDFIDRVIDEAKRSQRFCHFLGVVHRRDIPEEIWKQIKECGKRQ